jgi:hypothetical protein
MFQLPVILFSLSLERRLYLVRGVLLTAATIALVSSLSNVPRATTGKDRSE